MIWAVSTLVALYAVCLATLGYGFWRLPNFSAERLAPQTRFSVVIPFRNEAENLPALLKTIENLTYPSELFEIIFVNDASEDTSEAIVSEAIQRSRFSIKLLQNKRISNAPKKDAIFEAIKNSKFEWIITTDADCKLPKTWLSAFDAFIQKKKPVMVCGPVVYETDGSAHQNFQQWEGLALQMATMGSFGLNTPLMCNGANLAYQQGAFTAVNGFTGNDSLASGDDVFLLEKIKKAFPQRVSFIKSKTAAVATKSPEKWADIIQQRVRWASKTAKQGNRACFIFGIIVLLANFIIVGLPFFLFRYPEATVLLLCVLALKILADYLLVKRGGIFFGKEIVLGKFFLFPLLYAVLLIPIMVGSMAGRYSWKGRNYKSQR